MSETRLNYCQLLGLNPMKESSYSAADVAKRIDSRMTKWQNDSRNKQNDSEQRYRAERLVESVDDIRRIMSDPILRKGEFHNGQVILRGKVQKLRQDCIILSDGSYIILPGTIDNYIKKLHWEGVTKKDVLALAGISEGKPPEPVPRPIENAYKGLRAVDTYTPVELLNKIITHPNLEIAADRLGDNSPYPQIRQAFEVCDKRVNNVRPDILPDQDSYIQTLRAVKLVLEDKDLECLIRYGRCQNALRPVTETLEEEYNGQQLTRKYIDELMDAHLRGVDRDLAVLILQTFCYKKKISANFSNMDSQMMRCPECGNMVQAGPNTMFCPQCGKNFKTICPQCGTSQQARNKLCIKCGFDFEQGLRTAETLKMKFTMDLKNGMVSDAEDDLVKLRSAYPSFAEIPAMQVQLTRSQGYQKSMRKVVDDAYGHGRFHTCKTAVESFISKFPQVLREDPELKQMYDDSCLHVDQAALFCSKAEETDSHDRRMDCYVNAVEACPDHPEARSKLREHPPQGPTDSVGKLGMNENKFTIKFEPPENSNGLTYCIYRDRNSLPSVNEDSRPLAEIPGTAYVDRTLEPGVEYYYSVYSKRWGILSREGTHLGPVLFLADVDSVKIEQIDGGLRIMFEKPRGCSRVRLWRTEDTGANGIGTEIALNGEDVYDDIGLKGGRKYYYLFVAEYETRNKTERSEGVIYSGTPVDAPQPVRDMEIVRNKNDGTYTATWTSKADVVLYACGKRMALPGNLVKMEDIKTWMKEIMPVQTYPDGVRFELPDGVVQYIYPIIPCGRMGVKGTEKMIANLRPFRDVERTVSNRDCILTMIWPPEAVEAKLVISDDETRTLDDMNAEIMTVRKEEYQQDKMIRIPMGKSKKKCINIFAVYKLANQKVPSRGIALDVYSEECRKVRYTMKADRSGLHISLSADPDVTELFPMIAVKTSVGIPLRKTDGEVIWRSEGNVPVNSVIDIPGKFPEPRCIRLFFENDEYYNLYRFVHPLFRRD